MLFSRDFYINLFNIGVDCCYDHEYVDAMQYNTYFLSSITSQFTTIFSSNNAQQESSLVIINVYCPRADLDNGERLSFKLQFYRLLQQRAEAILNCNR